MMRGVLLLTLIKGTQAHIPLLVSHIYYGSRSSRFLQGRTMIKTSSQRVDGVAHTIPSLPQCGKTSKSYTTAISLRCVSYPCICIFDSFEIADGLDFLHSMWRNPPHASPLMWCTACDACPLTPYQPLNFDEISNIRYKWNSLSQVRGQHYDLVLNGVEIGGGSVRIHDPAMQEHVFSNVLQVWGSYLNFISFYWPFLSHPSAIRDWEGLIWALTTRLALWCTTPWWYCSRCVHSSSLNVGFGANTHWYVEF